MKRPGLGLALIVGIIATSIYLALTNGVERRKIAHMTYTFDKPTVPGWYWMRRRVADYRDNKPFSVITKIEHHPHGGLCEKVLWHRRPLADGAAWAGPILEPPCDDERLPLTTQHSQAGVE